MRPTWLLPFLVGSSCAFVPDLGGDPAIGCASELECPEGYSCPATELTRPRLCVPNDQAACGNGRIDSGEACDDGNLLNLDGCDAACELETCGNGTVETGEECDDGNDVDEDGCLSSCIENTCGDGFRNPETEECDDGNEERKDACLPGCLLNVCGDGLINLLEEECDDGNDDPADACLTDCRLNECGDGVLNPLAEACDDGNEVSGDGCRADCGKVEVCGDGLVDEGEACDDANANPRDACDACRAVAWSARVLLGQGSGQGEPLLTDLGNPRAVTVDREQNVYVASGDAVFRLDAAQNRIARVAGNGESGFSGDGGPATSARLTAPFGLAIDSQGRLHITDLGNQRVRRVNTDGTIETVVGAGQFGFGGDGGPALSASLASPSALDFDTRGRLLIADTQNSRVRRVELDGTIQTVAGSGNFGFDCVDGVATELNVSEIAGVAAAPDGGFYFSTGQFPACLMRVAPDGSATAVVTLDSIAPERLAVAPDGSVVFTEGFTGQSVKRVFPDGTVEAVAGQDTIGSEGDGGLATSAFLAFPRDVTVTSAGDVLIADSQNGRIRRVDSAGIITSLAGIGSALAGVGSLARGVALRPDDVALDAQDRLLVADPFHRVWRIDDEGRLEKIAGNGTFAAPAEGALANVSPIPGSESVVEDSLGRILIATGNAIYRVDVDGTIRRFAGTDDPDATLGDGGPALQARINAKSIHLDPQGRVLIAGVDSRVRRILLDGTIEAVAGTGTRGFNGDNQPAVDAQVRSPEGVCSDALGQVIIADTNNQRIRRVRLDGTIETIAGIGTGAGGSREDGVPATTAQVTFPSDCAVDDQGRILIAVRGHHQIRRINLDGTIETVAGLNDILESTGDGGDAIAANLPFAQKVALDSAGNLYAVAGFIDRELVRRVDVDGAISTVVGEIDPIVGGFTEAGLPTAVDFTALPGERLLVAGSVEGRIRLVDRLAERVEVVLGQPGGFDLGLDPVGTNRARFTRLLANAAGVAYHGSSRVFVSERDRAVIHALELVDPDDPSTWELQVFAGRVDEPAHADGELDSARFIGPGALTVFGDQLYVADEDGHTVRAVDLATDVVTTLLGEPGTPGSFAGLLNQPAAVAVGQDGALFVADAANHRVLRSDDAGVSTVIGTGEAASSGDGAPAATFPVQDPRGLTVDEYGNLIVSSTRAIRLLAASDDGVVDGTGAVFTIYGAAPRDTFPEDVTLCLTAVRAEPDRIVALDRCQGLLVEVVPETTP